MNRNVQEPYAVSRWVNREHPAMRAALIVAAFVSLGSVLGYIGLLLWAAREDGRDQRRRDAAERHSSGSHGNG